ncbi:DUF4132 domain-containing protein [Streptomyces sp. 35G-GA-8]|uniref:DUF4132 domain-containing protein n=1 Tax=Streptomyces sp. 35G-GA-8 TaxID=2939434 RepID=UPI00201F72DD|nr:DUF4132 domain-containing protein [Streptomyces sp. 35G-GA-8]MCL7377241.1 DUF4132 domain-containing protein [Streptomyces sp. 35G-GA-8]
MGWIETTGGYAIALDGTRVVCRNAAGRALKQVPPKLKDDAEVVRLRQLAEWLERHERECREQVDTWLVRSLPVPVALLARVWPDEAWQSALRDLVVAPVAADGSAETERAGFLRNADPARGLGIVDLDGDSVWLDAAEVETVLIPHPVLLEELADLREFAAELGVEQGAEQLFREVWRRPEGAGDITGGASGGGGTAQDWRAYADGKFAQLRHATARAVSLGYRVRGGQAVCPLVENGRQLEAAYWLGDDYPESETLTGSLEWRDKAGRRLPLTEVGPVAWSEGERMAALVYAGRVVESDEEKAL